jgi:hypothetical protein
MEKAEFIEPGVHARRNLLALYLAAVVIGALIVFFVRPALLTFLNGLPICERAQWSARLLLAYLAPLPVVGAWVVVHACRLLKANQSPLPNAWVWRRTPVKRGRPVRVQAYVLLACTAALLFVLLYAWHAFQPFWSALQQRCGA